MATDRLSALFADVKDLTDDQLMERVRSIRLDRRKNKHTDKKKAKKKASDPMKTADDISALLDKLSPEELKRILSGKK